MDIKIIRRNLNFIKNQLLSGKPEELTSLRAEKLKLEGELLSLKKQKIYAAEVAQKAKMRKLNDHYKFILGGLVIRDNPSIIAGFPPKAELEKITFKALPPVTGEQTHSPYDPEKWETIEIDGEEFYRLRRG